MLANNIMGTIKAIDSSFIWEIKDFHFLNDPPHCIQSPELRIDKFRWFLELWEAYNFISLHLFTDPDDIANNTIKISFEFSILNKFKQKAIIRSLENVQFDEENYFHGFTNFILKKNLFNQENFILFEDTLVILCEIHVNSEMNEKFPLIRKGTELTQDFESLFQNGDCSDLTIIVDNKELKAHKNILSARSKVFHAMFQHDMEENRKNLINITDTSYEVMKEVLRYIYCGKIEGIENIAASVLPVADKYDLNNLKLMCEDSLFKTLNNENACEILSLTETHSFTNLKPYVVNYTIANIKEVIDTSGFEELRNSNPKLLVDIFCEVVKK